MFAGCLQLIWVHLRIIWVRDPRYSQLIWAENRDVCGSGHGCLRAATNSYRIIRRTWGALDGIALRQGAHRQFKKGRIGFKIKIGGSVGQGHSPPARTTQRLLFPVTGAIFDQQPLTKGPTVVVTGTIGAVKRFPFHDIPSQRSTPQSQ